MPNFQDIPPTDSVTAGGSEPSVKPSEDATSTQLTKQKFNALLRTRFDAALRAKNARYLSELGGQPSIGAMCTRPMVAQKRYETASSLYRADTTLQFALHQARRTADPSMDVWPELRSQDVLQILTRTVNPQNFATQLSEQDHTDIKTILENARDDARDLPEGYHREMMRAYPLMVLSHRFASAESQDLGEDDVYSHLAHNCLQLAACTRMEVPNGAPSMPVPSVEDQPTFEGFLSSEHLDNFRLIASSVNVQLDKVGKILLD